MRSAYWERARSEGWRGFWGEEGRFEPGDLLGYCSKELTMVELGVRKNKRHKTDLLALLCESFRRPVYAPVEVEHDEERGPVVGQVHSCR